MMNPAQPQALLAASRLRAHPVSPGQRATDLVGYALAMPRGKSRGDGGSFLHTTGQNMSWWEVILADVVATYAALVLLVGWVVFKGMRWVLRSAYQSAVGGGSGGTQAGSIHGSKGKRE